jgi:hypothetical protein
LRIQLGPAVGGPDVHVGECYEAIWDPAASDPKEWDITSMSDGLVKDLWPALVWRVSTVADVEGLKEPEQHWGRTMDPEEVWLLGATGRWPCSAIDV